MRKEVYKYIYFIYMYTYLKGKYDSKKSSIGW